MGHHHHEHESGDHHAEPIPFGQKAEKLLQHWIHHNEEHAGSYRQWADEFRSHNLSAAAALLETAAELTMQINHALREAGRQIGPGGSGDSA